VCFVYLLAQTFVVLTMVSAPIYVAVNVKNTNE